MVASDDSPQKPGFFKRLYRGLQRVISQTHKKHSVSLRGNTTDVTTLDPVTFDEQTDTYYVEYKIPPIKQEQVINNPRVTGLFDIERRADGVYLVDKVSEPQAAYVTTSLLEEFID